MAHEAPTGSETMMMDGGSGWMMMLMFIVVFAVLVGAVFVAIKLAQPRRESTDEAREVLRQRLASGVIDEDEYTSRLTHLGR